MKNRKKEKIDTLILSDVHLGGISARCDDLLKVFKEYDADRIILNGDILDGLKFNRLHTASWKVLSVFRKLSKSREVVWIHGNHDANITIISNLIGIKSYNKYTWESNGHKCLAIHGHQFDSFLNNNYIKSQILFFLYNFLKQYSFTGRLLNYFRENNNTWRRNSKEVARGAIQHARLIGAKYVFCGHTHQIDRVFSKNVLYINTGSWSEPKSGIAVIAGGKVDLKIY